MTRSVARRTLGVVEANGVQGQEVFPLGGAVQRVRFSKLVAAAIAALIFVSGMGWLALQVFRDQPAPSTAPSAENRAGTEPPAGDEPAPLSTADVARLVLPSAVAIRCSERPVGSGFFVTEELILTNAHVLCTSSTRMSVAGSSSTSATRSRCRCSRRRGRASARTPPTTNAGSVAQLRAQNYSRLAQELSEQHDAKFVSTFWLINAVVVEMPLEKVASVTEREDVLSVEPEDSGEKPPADANPNNDVQDGRARIVSDPYFNVGLTGGFIGLLDTGLRFTHTQFNSPSHIAFRRDCVNGGPNCNNTSAPGFNPSDDCWNHGTSSAAIITANSNQGVAFRGVTGVTLDSFKVYPSGCIGLNAAAAVRGFQAAVTALDRVIVAEIQGGGSDTSSISSAADAAFDAGAVVIAANGNFGPAAGTVNSPANAHKVISVGAFHVETLAQMNGQSRGPTLDYRIEPDIQTPTLTETASNVSNTAFRVFGGTSGATPYAAGAAALLRNWLRGTASSIDPGQVYAQLILSGQQPYPFNNTSGAGRLRLPTDGLAWWGKVSVTDGEVIDIPLGISGGFPTDFDGALWWPESPTTAHNDVDLTLVDPSGAVRASSISIPSVFERARVAGPVSFGSWKIRIRGYDVRTASQTVYWAAHVRR